jgi:hypothetical protein
VPVACDDHHLVDAVRAHLTVQILHRALRLDELSVHAVGEMESLRLAGCL